MAKLKSLSALPLLLLAALLPSLAKAQDVNLDLTAQTATGDKVNVTVNGCTFTYDMATSPNTGAYMNYLGDLYKFKITSSDKKIAVIELVGRGNVNNVSKPTDVNVEQGGGTFDHHPGGTSVWKGPANTVQFGAASGSTYTVQRIRVWYEGTEYVPGGSGDGDDDPSGDDVTGTPIVRTPSVPVNGKAVKMAIVTVKQFKEVAEEYALWKTQQGYDVTEIYVDDLKQGANDQNIDDMDAYAKRIHPILKELRPAFVLIMGDYEQVPAFKGTKAYPNNYVTDYFYGEYSGDYFPEAYVGRFSGYTADEIKAQMDKTKYMSLISASEGSWMNTSLGLHNRASNLTTAPGYDYVMNYLRSIPNVTVNETSAGYNTTINDYINQGSALVTYYGHGYPNSFNGEYQLADAQQLTNENRYPLFITMTCLTGKFDNGWQEVLCMAEQMQRMPKAGSVAYIGATRESYDWPNIHFMKGGKQGDNTYLGFMASMFPTSDKDPLNQHARTLGEGVAMGKYGVNAYQKSSAEFSSEYYVLFGDPTYQPYCKAPLTMQVNAPANAVAGHVIKVTAAPKTVVCISTGRNIVAVGLTDSEGHISLKIATAATAGTYTLYCSAPTYTDWQGSITIAANDGKEDTDPFTQNILKPVLTASDVIDHETAQTVNNQWKQVIVSGESGAKYDTWVSSDLKDCVNMRNEYDLCGIVTTKTAGCVRKVSIDWVAPAGKQDCISVFGSNTPYSVASDVWDDSKKGTLIGTIVKGVNDELVIPTNYAYVALRAENLDCFMNSITIGWGGETFEVEEEDLKPSTFDFDDFTRKKVLIEKFTGQRCPNCIGDDKTLDAYLDGKNLKDKVYEMRHYSYEGDGIGQRYLRLPDVHNALSNAWEVSSYPIYMVDRSGNNGTQFPDNGYLVRASVINNLDWVSNRIEKPCLVSLSLDGSTYNPSTREIKVVVSGKTSTKIPDPRISIFITQNGISASQSGVTGDYVHNGVSRDFLTEEVNGDALEIGDDGVFQVTYFYKMPETIGSVNTDIKNMDVVAFVSSWDNYAYKRATEGQKNFENSMVYNTDNVNIGSLPFHALPPVLPGDNKPYEVTIGATGFSTLYCDKDLVVPEGVTAYVAYESESGSSLITKELADGTIPAKTAVILQGTQGVHSFTVSPKKLTAYTGRNELNGTLERVSASSLGGTIYVLAQPAGKSVGFYRYTGDMLPAHKAYFREVDGKVQGFELNFGGEGDVVTAIDRLSTVNSQLSTAYDLQGRALRQGKSAPQRGLILQNGKKLMVR